MFPSWPRTARSQPCSCRRDWAHSAWSWAAREKRKSNGHLVCGIFCVLSPFRSPRWGSVHLALVGNQEQFADCLAGQGLAFPDWFGLHRLGATFLSFGLSSAIASPNLLAVRVWAATKRPPSAAWRTNRMPGGLPLSSPYPSLG